MVRPWRLGQGCASGPEELTTLSTCLSRETRRSISCWCDCVCCVVLLCRERCMRITRMRALAVAYFGAPAHRPKHPTSCHHDHAKLTQSSLTTSKVCPYHGWWTRSCQCAQGQGVGVAEIRVTGVCRFDDFLPSCFMPSTRTPKHQNQHP